MPGPKTRGAASDHQAEDLFSVTARTDQRSEGVPVQCIALAQIDGAPEIAFKAALNGPEGSPSEAPLAKVSFTTLL